MIADQDPRGLALSNDEHLAESPGTVLSSPTLSLVSGLSSFETTDGSEEAPLASQHKRGVGDGVSPTSGVAAVTGLDMKDGNVLLAVSF
jgi:hypothetical protein